MTFPPTCVRGYDTKLNSYHFKIREKSSCITRDSSHLKNINYTTYNHNYYCNLSCKNLLHNIRLKSNEVGRVAAGQVHAEPKPILNPTKSLPNSPLIGVESYWKKKKKTSFEWSLCSDRCGLYKLTPYTFSKISQTKTHNLLKTCQKSYLDYKSITQNTHLLTRI